MQEAILALTVLSFAECATVIVLWALVKTLRLRVEKAVAIGNLAPDWYDSEAGHWYNLDDRLGPPREYYGAPKPDENPVAAAAAAP